MLPDEEKLQGILYMNKQKSGERKPEKPMTYLANQKA
jgi:hypothetical protein